MTRTDGDPVSAIFCAPDLVFCDAGRKIAMDELPCLKLATDAWEINRQDVVLCREHERLLGALPPQECLCAENRNYGSCGH